MRKLLFILFCITSAPAFAQVNNIYQSGGISFTVGAPTYRPGSRGNIIAVDTTTHLWYVSTDRNGVNWLSMGFRVEVLAGCVAPAYTPSKFQSPLVVNECSPNPVLFKHVGGGVWEIVGGGGGGGGSVLTDATLTGDGTAFTPLGIAQQGALEGQVLSWTGTTWAPTWGNPYIFVTTTGAVTSAENTVLVGDLVAGITMGLPSCNAVNDEKEFKFIKNGSDNFGLTIDPSGAELFYDGAATKTIYSTLSFNCLCRFDGITGVWFFTKM